MWKFKPYRAGDNSVYDGSASIIGETGASCCSNEDWTELFYGLTHQLGLTERYYGYDDEFPNPPLKVIYPFTPGYPHTGAIASADGDTGGAPSPSGTYLAVTSPSSGTARVFKVNKATGARTALTTGYQPDWQRVSWIDPSSVVGMLDLNESRSGRPRSSTAAMHVSGSLTRSRSGRFPSRRRTRCRSRIPAAAHVPW
jgi:hypothetical protein